MSSRSAKTKRKGVAGKAETSKAAKPRSSKPKTAKPTTANRRSVFGRLVRWAARALALAVAFCVFWVLAYRVIDPPGGIYMAREAWRLGGITRDWRDIEEISPRLARAVMAAEDARFCAHYGFDFEAIQAALAAAERGGRARGASTISQQVAKNVFLWHGRLWVRKGLEAWFSVLIELFWSKQRILEVYLNTAEFDEGVFGAEAAARHYFGRPAVALTPQQAARLAAILPNPKGRSAARPSGSVRRRAGQILAGARTLERQGRDRCAFE